MQRLCAASFVFAILYPFGSMFLAGGAVLAEEPLRTILESRYAALRAAMISNNGAAIRLILTPDFQSIDVSGRPENAQQMIADLTRMPPDPKRVSTTTVLWIGAVDGAISVKQQYQMTTVKLLAGGAQAVKLVVLSTDTWVKAGDTLRLKKTVTDEMSYYTDGRLVMRKVKPEA